MARCLQRPHGGVQNDWVIPVRKTLVSLAFLLVMPTPTMAIELPCNFAVQNWFNGSQDTCPLFGAGMQKATPKPRTFKKKVDTCDSESGCEEECRSNTCRSGRNTGRLGAANSLHLK